MANGNGLTVRLPDAGTGYTLAPGGNALLLPASAPNQLAQPAPSGDSYISSFATHGPEGTGQNPYSSAYGTGQFISGTWNEFAQDNPDMFRGMTPQQILDKRSDPAYGNKAIEWYAQKNADALKAAGVDVTGQNLRVAHGLGAAGAIPVLKAADADPLSRYLTPAAITANPSWRNMTVGQFKGQYAGVPLPENLGGPKYTTIAASSTAPAASSIPQDQQRTPALQLPTPPDPRAQMAQAMYKALLPVGFTYQPIDYNPFRGAFERGHIDVRLPEISGLPGVFRPQRVEIAPARAAYSPASFPGVGEGYRRPRGGE